MVLPTIYSVHAPAAEHRARRQAAGVPAPAVTLSPLDAFLLTRIAAFLPHPLTVVDLAAAATDGDSEAVLKGAGITVVSPHHEPTLSVLRSKTQVLNHEAHNGVHHSEPRATTVSLTVDDPDATDVLKNWETAIKAVPAGEQVLVLLAETTLTAAHTEAHLVWLAERLPAAPILVFPLGATGTGEVLAQAVRSCPPGGARRLIALREQAPFFASSELGFVFSAGDAVMTVVLERLAGMVTGNFQFLSLVRDAVQAATHITAIEAELVRVQAAYMQAEAARAQTEAAYASHMNDASLQSEAARLHAEQAFVEKTRYAEWLEGRLSYLENSYIPWKNSVLTGLENEVRNLYASKALRLERLLRRMIYRQ